MQNQLSDMVKRLKEMSPEMCARAIQTMSRGFDANIGLEYTHVSAKSVQARLVVEAKHLQPYGLTHGGLYCTIGESICSVGANLATLPDYKMSVGHRNTTTFLRGSRKGSQLLAVAVASRTGESNRLLWTFTIKDESNNLCAEGEVLLAVHDHNTDIAGQPLDFAQG